MTSGHARHTKGRSIIVRDSRPRIADLRNKTVAQPTGHENNHSPAALGPEQSEPVSGNQEPPVLGLKERAACSMRKCENNMVFTNIDAARPTLLVRNRAG